MALTGPGERAVRLPRIVPDRASLEELAQSPDEVNWSRLRADPGLLFQLLARDIPFDRNSPSCLATDDLSVIAQSLHDPANSWADWRNPDLRPVLRSVVSAAMFAEILAETLGTVDPARAWTGAWLAYVGWLTVGVAETRSVRDCLASATYASDPFGTQLRVWGKTRSEIAWRLSSTWPMPQWARVILGRLDATPDEAEQFGGDRGLQALVQTAVVLAEQSESRLYVADEFNLSAALGELRFRSVDLDGVRERYAAEADIDAWLDREWTDPRTDTRLANRLLTTNTAEVHEPERVQTSMVDLFAERVHAAKLAAIAEFAAGASHEINNPLAVISGQSQYLLKQETDALRRRSLQSIVRQTRRINGILTELMYFARPPIPQLEWVELGRLIREAAVPVAPLAAERKVDLQLAAAAAPLWIDVDVRQMVAALSALIRNGVEAAPPGGWVRVSTHYRSECLNIVVEDSGPGPDERSREHMFDPFYSGRAAGRGRGLGLSAAWRLAREHGGEVRFVPVDNGPTRFVISLPPSAVVNEAQRKSA